MLAYAANRPRIAARQSSPNTLLFIICGHIVLIAAIMSVKMGIAPTVFDPPTTIVSVPLTREPPPRPIRPTPVPQGSLPSPTPHQSTELRPPSNFPVTVDIANSADAVSAAGAGNLNLPTLPPLPQAAPVSSPAVPMTPAADLKPPYPEAKLLAGEEATLTLRLTVDKNGRVVAVDPIGRADQLFLAAARKHLMAHWRYKPAMKDGTAVASTVVITLHFELNG